MAGVTYNVTLPGMKKEPITIPDTATVADFCREVFHKTGVTLFNGFGFKSQNDVSGNPIVYYVPKAGVITNVKIEKRDSTGAITVAGPTASFANAVVRTGSETLMNTLASHGDELIIFNVPFGE